jgi:hypothetical protein
MPRVERITTVVKMLSPTSGALGGAHTPAASFSGSSDVQNKKIDSRRLNEWNLTLPAVLSRDLAKNAPGET